MGIFLQIFLLVNVFLIGIGVAVGARHALAHFRPHPEEKKVRDAEQTVKLSAQTRAQLIKEAEDTYRAVLTKTTNTLVGDLEQTAGKLNKGLDELGNKIINEALAGFKQKLEEIHATTAEASKVAVEDISAYQAQAKKKMQAEL